MSITMKEKNFEFFLEKINGKDFPSSEFTGFDSVKGKPFVAYVYKTDRIMADYVKFVETHPNLSDYELFDESYRRGYLQVYYYEYPRLEHTGNNYLALSMKKKIRKRVEKEKIMDIRNEFDIFKIELKKFEEKLNSEIK